MPRLQQEPLSTCAFVTYASIIVASHSEPEIQWLSRTDLIAAFLPFLILSFSYSLHFVLFNSIIRFAQLCIFSADTDLRYDYSRSSGYE